MRISDWSSYVCSSDLPLRLLRGAARGILRIVAAWFRSGPREGRFALCVDQHRGLVAVPDRRQPHLRRDGDAQHGRSRDPYSGHCRGGSGAFAERNGDPGHAFLIKAGMWPLGFWLPATYSAAAPPVAALFAILSKVGIYAVLRVYLLLFGGDEGWTVNFGEGWLLFGGMATIVFGTIGVLASRTLSRLAGYCIVISSGTLLATIGAGEGAVLGGALLDRKSTRLNSSH